MIALFTNIFVTILGLCVGSFLNVVIYRLEKEETLMGRSYCPHCNHQLYWPDLIPVFSFLWLHGKCRYCRSKISIQYPLIEISTALIFLLIFNFKFLILNQFSISQFLNLIFLWYITSSFIVIFVYDLKHYIIPDKILFPAIIVTFLYRVFENWNLFGNWKLGIGIFSPLMNYMFAALIASLFFLIIFLISKGAAIGFGDVKLAVLMGLLLGFPNILLGLFLGFLFGAIIGVGLMLRGRKKLKSEVPFAPFLIMGTAVAFFWGPQIMDWYVTNFLIF